MLLRLGLAPTPEFLDSQRSLVMVIDLGSQRSLDTPIHLDFPPSPVTLIPQDSLPSLDTLIHLV